MKVFVRLPPYAFRLPAWAGGAVAVFWLTALSPPAHGQTRGVEIIRQQKAEYPENLLKGAAQGNVILIARIDRNGTVQDARALWASHSDFIPPTLVTVKNWSFRPALQNGQPIEIAYTIVFPFRIRDDKGKVVGHELLGPALTELALYPADASGRGTAPEGFPLRKGKDPRVRVEASVDLPVVDKERILPVKVDAISPAAKRSIVYETKVPVPRKQTSFRLRFSVPVGADWEDGVWLLRFAVDSADAGGGQFWLARDPAHFDFAAALRRLSP